jgi:ATP-dependent RNA helicase DHX36
VLCHICQKERDGAVLVFMTGWDDINTLKDQLQSNPLLGDPSKVLLLACHGSMASAEQVLLRCSCFLFVVNFSTTMVSSFV